MHPKTEIWNILHDGTIVNIQETVPGVVQLRVQIEYLRKFFFPPGECFLVTLNQCSRLRMFLWSDSTTTDDFDRIIGLKCDVLSTASESCPAKIVTSVGDLELDYQDLNLQLDTGESVSHEEISRVCDQYWDNFGKRKTDPSTSSG